jgi:hypothetical protein
MMGQLERRAEVISGEFNSQNVANTLWALSFFSVHFNIAPRLYCFLTCRLLSIDFDDKRSLCQLHQGFMSCDMIEGLHADFSVSVQALKE